MFGYCGFVFLLVIIGIVVWYLIFEGIFMLDLWFNISFIWVVLGCMVVCMNDLNILGLLVGIWSGVYC